MRLLLLNQYGPPDASPTARLLGELADFLRTQGHEIEVVARGEKYGGRPARGRGRLRREIAALLHILRVGWRRRRPSPDIVLAFSSPPGLLVVGAALAWRHRARLAHWALDLYPELAVALDELPDGRLVGLVRAAMEWAYRRSALVVALDEDMRAHLQPLCRTEVRTLEPWPAPAIVRQLADTTAADSSSPDNPAPWTWLYSGNLGRAHEWRTLLEAQALLEASEVPAHLVFQGDGAARRPAMLYAQRLGLRHCEWRGYVPEGELLPVLLRARVLIVTQRPETRGLLWPSKLALLERLPVPVLFVGPTDGAVARRLQARGGAGVFRPDQAEAVADWIEEQFRHPSAPSLSAMQAALPSPGESCVMLERWLREFL